MMFLIKYYRDNILQSYIETVNHLKDFFLHPPIAEHFSPFFATCKRELHSTLSYFCYEINFSNTTTILTLYQHSCGILTAPSTGRLYKRRASFKSILLYFTIATSK